MTLSRCLGCFLAFLFSLSLSSNLSAQRPVAWYPLNGTGNDAGPNGIHGRVVGAQPTVDRFGDPHGALAFNESEQDHVVIPHSRLLSFGTRDFTVVAWVKFCDRQLEYAGIVCKGPANSSYPGYQLHIASNDKITTQIGDEGNWSDERRGKEPLADGRWHLLAVAVSPANNTIVQYVDGRRVTSWTQVYTQRGPLNVSRFDPTPLYIGVERNTDRFFNGAIDDVRLFDRTLSDREMRSLYYENGWSGEEEVALGPVAYYPFNGNANDASGNGLNGIVNGAVPTYDRFGNCKSAYAFNGEERDYIAVRHNPLLAFGTNDFTVVSWVKFRATQPEYAGIVCKGPANNPYPGYQLHIADGAAITTQIGDDGNSADEKRGFDKLNDGKWHMLAVTVSPAQDVVTLYVDGEEIDYYQYYSQQGALSVSRFDPTPLFIGTERNTDRFFTGVIDDVRLFDRVLSRCDLRILYHENGWDGVEGDPRNCDVEYNQEFGPEEWNNAMAVAGLDVSADAASDQSLTVAPNPVDREVLASFVLAKTGRVTVELFSANGEKVGTILKEEREAGRNEIRFSTSDLSAGAYTLRLVSEGRISSCPVIVR